MARPEIKGCLLIESPASESDDQFRAYVTELLSSVYGRMPEWLEFSVGRRILWRHAQFREFICVAGSVSARLILQASSSGGISRAIILYGSSRNGDTVSQEIRGGVETRFDPDELHVA
jgi:hypothetical protein